ADHERVVPAEGLGHGAVAAQDRAGHSESQAGWIRSGLSAVTHDGGAEARRVGPGIRWRAHLDPGYPGQGTRRELDERHVVAMIGPAVPPGMNDDRLCGPGRPGHRTARLGTCDPRERRI